MVVLISPASLDFAFDKAFFLAVIWSILSPIEFARKYLLFEKKSGPEQYCFNSTSPSFLGVVFLFLQPVKLSENAAKSIAE